MCHFKRTYRPAAAAGTPMLNNKKCFFQKKQTLIHQRSHKQNIYFIILICMVLIFDISQITKNYSAHSFLLFVS